MYGPPPDAGVLALAGTGLMIGGPGTGAASIATIVAVLVLFTVGLRRVTRGTRR